MSDYSADHSQKDEHFPAQQQPNIESETQNPFGLSRPSKYKMLGRSHTSELLQSNAWQLASSSRQDLYAKQENSQFTSVDFLNEEMVPCKGLDESDRQSDESISASNLKQEAVSRQSHSDHVHEGVDAESFLCDNHSVSNATPGFNRANHSHVNMFESMSALSEPPQYGAQSMLKIPLATA